MSEAPAIIYREATAADSYAVAQVQVHSWQESFKGLVPQSFLDGMSVEQRAEAFLKRAENGFYKMFLAEAQGRGVVGFMDIGRSRDSQQPYEAELYAIYILKEFQRMGIGRRLFNLGVEAALAVGMNSMYLIALEVSPYKSFYEKLGGRRAGKRAIVLAGVEYSALVYSWDKLG
ncbi:MAG: GNAT family N-acetyltransferase [Pyrinomonadaceae bacterium]